MNVTQAEENSEGANKMVPVIGIKLQKYVGRVIKITRNAKEMTQFDLGMQIGKDSTYISKIERGKPVSFRTVAIIAYALGVPLSQLIREAEELMNQEGENGERD